MVVYIFELLVFCVCRNVINIGGWLIVIFDVSGLFLKSVKIWFMFIWEWGKNNCFIDLVENIIIWFFFIL